MLVTSVAVCLGVYAVGVTRLWSSAGYGRGIRPFEALAFVTGSSALMLALSRLISEWSERWQAAHMVQHELLMVVAAPLVAFGAPLVGMLWGVPPSVRRAIVGTVHGSCVARLWTTLTAPHSAFFIYGAALWLWHVPPIYDAAQAHEGVHAVQHVCFFWTSALFWWGIVHGRYGRSGYGAAVVYLFLTALHGGLLGALMTVAPRVWYAPYLAHPSTGLTPLEDQQLAGLLMWVPGGLAFVAGALWLLAGWLRHSDRMSRFTSAPVLRATNSE